MDELNYNIDKLYKLINQIREQEKNLQIIILVFL